jgi:hypothetical protein
VTNGELTHQTQDDGNGGRRAVLTADDTAGGFAVWITNDAAGRQTAVMLTGTVPEDDDPPLPGVCLIFWWLMMR